MGFGNNRNFEGINNQETPEEDNLNEDKSLFASDEMFSVEEMPSKEIPDENAESEIIEKVEDSLTGNEEGTNLDKFGFVSVLEDYFNRVADDKKDELFEHINDFLVEYRTILDNKKDKRAAIKAASKAFETIIGVPITSYDKESGKVSLELYVPEQINVPVKKAPVDATKAFYNAKGQPVRPTFNEKDNKDNKNKDTNKSKNTKKQKEGVWY